MSKAKIVKKVLGFQFSLHDRRFMSQAGERDISRGARHEREARDEGKRKNNHFIFSLPLVSRFALVSRSARNIAFTPLGL